MRLRQRRHEHAGYASAVVEQVEPRLLFSADLAGALILGADAADAGVEQRMLQADGEYAAQAATVAAESTASPQAAASHASVATNYAALGLAFEQNQGQAGEADYTAYGSGYAIALQDGNAALSLLTAQGQATVTLQLGGDARAAQAEGEGLLGTRSNYLLGNDPSAWRTGIANYGSVLYRGVYEGIDVRYYGNQRQLEYDFIVAAGADAGAISLRFNGIESASIGPGGDLVLRVAGSDSDVRFRAPVSYQRGDHGLEAVASRYEIRADGSIGFVVGSYDTSRELVIDPVLDYASYFGTAGDENAPAITVDAAGNVYITGRTTGSGSPLGGVSGPGGGAGDIYVAKLSADLSTVLFSTRLGGSGDEQANAIAVDAAGNIAVTGWTRSGNFPLQSAADSSRDGAQDAIIFKLNSSGGLVFSTYFGGGSGDTDSGNAVAMDSSGNVYAAGQGRVDPGLLPLLLQILLGSSDNAFINKYSATGGVVYQELFGGSSTDGATGIALGAGNDVFVVGATSSGDWNGGASGPDGSLGGSRDGFLLHLDAAGNNTYSTYIGGSSDDFATGVATDGNGKAFVVGVTRGGTGFTTTAGAFQAASAAAGQDTGFLRVYDLARPAASSLVYSSYLGGSGVDRPTGVAHVNGRVVIVGEAGSTDFPITADALQSTGGGSPLYLVVLDPKGNGAADLHYGTYYADGLASVGGVAVSGNHVYVSGQITSAGWATTGAYQTAPQGSDAFVAAFTLPNTAPVLNGLVQPPAIAEDAVGDPGFLVSSLLAGQVVDNDFGAVQGVVVIGADSTNGTWEYTTDGGATWNAVVATSITSGLLLAADAQTRLRFIPHANYNGTVTAGLTLRAWDRTSGTAGGRADTTATGGTTAFSVAGGTVDITVTPVNDAPVAAADTLAATEDTPVTYTAAQLLGNDSDVEGDPLTITGVTSGAGGTVTLNADGTVTFTPGANFNGPASFTYQVSDGLGSSASATVSIAVAAMNDAPTNSPVTLPGMAEDAGSIVLTAAQLLGNATDVDGDTLSVVNLVADSGSLTANADATWTFTPGTDFNGTVSFSYDVDDGWARVAGAATLVVTPVNDAPTNAPVSMPGMAEDGGSVVLTAAQLLANAGDIDGDTLSIVNLVADSGSLVANADGTWTFTPGPDFNSAVNFSYEVDDGTARVAGSASLVVAAVNDAPTNAPVTLPGLAEDAGSVVLTAAQLLGNATDVDGDTLSVVNLVADSGSLTANADGTWIFTPGADFNGTVSFSYDVDDGRARVAGAATLVVTPVNDAPINAPVSLPGMAEDGGSVVLTAAQLLANAGDVDGDALSVVSLVAGSGSLVANPDGTWTFTPAADFNGTVSFSYDVDDGTARVAGAATLLVTPINDAPTNAPVSLPGMAEDAGSVVLTAAQLLGNAADADGDTLSVLNLVADAGSLVANADGTWTFTPAADFNGTVSFSYEVDDGTARVAGAATLPVTPVNDAPTNAPVTLPGMAEDGGSIVLTAAQLLGNAADADGDALSVVNLVADAGSLVANADGTWTFTPAADFNGSVNFSYDVDDGTTRVAGSATLAVAPVNDRPTSAPVTLSGMAEDGGSIVLTAAQLLGNAADVDDDSLSVVNLMADSGSLTANADGTWTFTPGADFNGTVSFSYDVDDGSARVAGAATLAVTPVNDAPANAPVSLPAMAEDGGSVVLTAAQLLANAADVDGDTLTVVNLVVDAGSLVANADGTWTFTPAADFNGTVRFSWGVDDGTTRVSGTATLVVTPVNDAPLITSPRAEPVAEIDLPEHQAVIGAVTASDVDTPSAQLVFSIGGGADASLFVIDSATGELRFAVAPQFNSPQDADGDNVYEVVVQVSDATLVDTQRLAIRVLSTTPPVQEPANPMPPTPSPAPLPPEPVAPVTPAPQRGPDAAPLPSDRTSDALLGGFGPAVETAVTGFSGEQTSFAAQQAARLLLEAGTSPALRTVVFDREGLDLLSSLGGLDMILARFGIQDRFEAGAPEDLQRTFQSASFARELDHLRNQVREELQLDKAITISVASVSLGISFAYVLWLIRGGVLLGSYLSAMPAWRLLDPLPVLPKVEEEDEEEDDEPLGADRRSGRDLLRGY